MIREEQSSQQDVYLLSLDTFMIMAVMGITVGILFILFNPTLRGSVSHIKPVATLRTIDQTEYNEFTQDPSVRKISSYSELFLTRESFPDGHQEILILSSGGYVQRGYYTKTSSGEIHQISLEFTPIGDAKYKLSLQYIDPEENTYIYKSDTDEESEAHNTLILNMVDFWPGLRNQLFEVLE